MPSLRKTLRRSFDRAAEQGPIHMISAWSSQQRLRECKATTRDRQEQLEVLLRTIDRPGEYCMQDRLLAPMPRVEVEGARSLSGRRQADRPRGAQPLGRLGCTEEQACSLASGTGQQRWRRRHRTAGR